MVAVGQAKSAAMESSLALGERQRILLAFTVVMLVLAFTLVALRLLARIKYGPGLWWDDYFILVALVSLTVPNVAPAPLLDE